MTEQIAKGHIKLGEDFMLHRVTGYVPHAAMRGMDPNLDCPLITPVIDNLWQGGCFNGVRLPDGFDFVLSLYPWEKYALPTGCVRNEVEMYDSLDQSTEQALELAGDVVKLLDHDKTVLIHCQAGLNRSGLITAAVLCLRGMDPDSAINLMRGNRSPLVLSNETFETFIRSHDWSTS